MSADDARTLHDVRDAHRHDQRALVLDAASRVLAHDGLSALTVRRVAREVGASTTVIYTLFGGKEGLLDALWAEGFDRLWQLERAVPPNAPLEHLRALGEAYWRNAVENPDYYAIVFGGAAAGFTPSAEARARGDRAFGVLVDAVQACIDAGAFRDEDARSMAQALWAGVHGVVSLHLAGHLPDREAAHALRGRVGRALAAVFLAQGGATPAAEEGP